ncbi:alpha-hydroxy-acid oxidizing protein [Pseudonocardia sp. WMMC193]|uniref:alpha-hydroxy-acid oxidizing protein n=1 Tax=Pseudonocardia sp. WMMC193 TaxID=2911965 RepID=UPI001F01C2F1|nr:alpha-hydroxy-acid oxidizing protein [Pseudonocardia sp. WMMC193]MCF7548233.1 alpha-hydroxy-acid oxidizing protein [Pseudonocardia sp. WMMC193]
MAEYADFNLGIYLAGLGGDPPPFPVTFAGLEAAARERLEHRLFDYVAGGAGDEHTQRGNVAAFERWGIVPRMLAGAAERDLSVELFGHRLPTPLLLSPIGVVGVMTEDGHGDLATAAASANSGVPMVASTLMQDPLEEVAARLGDTPGFFQLYTPNDRDLAESLVRRAEAAGFRGIVVTLDTWTLGYRPRDLQHATFPQLRGHCLANYFSDPVFRSRLAAPPEEDPGAATLLWASIFGNPGLTWDDLAWLRGLTDLPLLLKGICHPDDVRRARDGGVDGIYCSNHGGRQAATAPALDLLPAVVDAADGLPVIFDSGVRSGPDIVKALALGATAVGIGRPYGYGAAIGGRAGVEFVLSCLLAEADLTMGLNGYARIADLTRDVLVRTPGTPTG